MKKILLYLSFIALLAACKKEDIDSQPQTGNSKITQNAFSNIEGDYIFVGYSVSKTLGSDKVTLSLKKQSADKMGVSGRSFVNSYGGNFSFDDSKNTIGYKEFFTTLMASTEPTLNQAEGEYYSNLQKVKRFVIENDQLKLFDTEPATEIMIFKKK